MVELKLVKTGKVAFQVKVTLLGVNPPVWRRFLADPAMTLHKFHKALQEVMGWMDGHLYEFDCAGIRVGVPDPDFGDEIISSRKVKLGEVLRAPGDKVEYLYDPGDGWYHKIFLEKFVEPEPSVKLPHCLAGKRACPSEDCGGPWGYKELLAALADPRHPAHKDKVEWLDRPFDPEAFNLKDMNEGLRIEFK